MNLSSGQYFTSPLDLIAESIGVACWYTKLCDHNLIHQAAISLKHLTSKYVQNGLMWSHGKISAMVIQLPVSLSVFYSRPPSHLSLSSGSILSSQLDLVAESNWCCLGCHAILVWPRFYSPGCTRWPRASRICSKWIDANSGNNQCDGEKGSNCHSAYNFPVKSIASSLPGQVCISLFT